VLWHVHLTTPLSTILQLWLKWSVLLAEETRIPGEKRTNFLLQVTYKYYQISCSQYTSPQPEIKLAKMVGSIKQKTHYN